MRKFFGLLLVIAAFFVLSACSPVPVHSTAIPSGGDFLQAATYVMLIFGTMAGIPLAIAAVVSLVKVLLVAVSWFASQITKKEIHWSIDNYSGQIAALLNIAAFGFLIYFRVFQPNVSFDWLDEQAKQIAALLTYVAVLFGQLKLSPLAYGVLKNQVPILGYSYSPKK